MATYNDGNQYLGGSATFDESAGGQSNPIGGAGGQFSSYFFNDPVQRYYESALRKRIGEVNQPMEGGNKLPGMDDFKSLLGQFGGSAGGGGMGTPAATRLDPFKAFAASFNPGVADNFNSYVQSRNPGQGTQGLADYTQGRDALSGVNELKDALAAMGPNSSIDDLKAYFAGRDTNAPVDTLQKFLTDNAGMLTGYEGNMAERIAQLRGNPFDDSVLEARRNAGFTDIEREHQVELQQLGEKMAQRGIAPGSGLFDRAKREIDSRYDQRRQEQQGQMTTEEFTLREERGKQADLLENQGASFRLQSAQLAGDLTGQIAQLQQQGLGMNDALQQTIANLGLQSRKQEQDMLANIATLTNQGYQLQDALQMALTNAGLESQKQADQLRTSGAEVGLKEADMMRSLQEALASLGVTERGQDTNLQIAGINAASQGQASTLGALMDYFRIGQQQDYYDEARRDKAVDWAGLLNEMARNSLKDASGNLPTLPGGV